MNKTTMQDSQEYILAMFQKLMAERNKSAIKVATKQEEAEKESNQQLLQTASQYTVDNIVKGLADLQLEFGEIITSLAEKLGKEHDKVDELKSAIAVETQHLQELKNIRLVADTLHILQQEHQEKLRLIEAESDRQKEDLDREIGKTRKSWQQEQQERTEEIQQQLEIQQKYRQKEAEEYAYKLELTRKRVADANTSNKAALEIELRENNEVKAKDWRERETVLKNSKAEFEQNQKQIATFTTEIEEAIKKAREEAIKDVHKEAKIKADLFEKEWQGSKQSYEFQIQSLEQNVAKQLEQIQGLSTQLEAVMKQAQGLAVRALDNSANK
ncbi:hypothetical protein [Merismopedia glauca]|uniref:Myosin heavy chain n=1 Tax=Merismopedia glauca CCAP 1448/3 TaxID=1296344 RepID=A0A2T1C321_9CYAN|nr:hypothetical protein [Merismopedia glauca]PSB02666.1 hypothetical protein C7B64_12160 [Merismopedia glauca CCAP 1448/3]